MKFLSSNAQFYLIFSKLLFLLLFVVFLNYDLFIGKTALQYVSPSAFIYYGCVFIINYLFFYFFWCLYKGLKIHKLKKTVDYSNLLGTLIKQKTAEASNTCANVNSKDKEQQLLQKYLACYVWLRNSHTQKGVNAFIIALLFFYCADFTPSPVNIILPIVAFILLFWGLEKVARGYIEIA